jgi:hypothetical protein
LHRGGGPKKIVAVPKRGYKSVHKPNSLDRLSVKELRKLIDVKSFENDRGQKLYTSTALKPDLLNYLYNEKYISESHDKDYNYKVDKDYKFSDKEPTKAPKLYPLDEIKDMSLQLLRNIASSQGDNDLRTRFVTKNGRETEVGWSDRQELLDYLTDETDKNLK